MIEMITKNEDGELFVKTHMTPGFRMVVVTCLDKGDEDNVVLIDRREVERLIEALQNSLDSWDENNGLS